MLGVLLALRREEGKSISHKLDKFSSLRPCEILLVLVLDISFFFPSLYHYSHLPSPPVPPIPSIPLYHYHYHYSALCAYAYAYTYVSAYVSRLLQHSITCALGIFTYSKLVGDLLRTEPLPPSPTSKVPPTRQLATGYFIVTVTDTDQDEIYGISNLTG